MLRTEPGDASARTKQTRIMRGTRPLGRAALIAVVLVPLLIGLLLGGVGDYLLRGPTAATAPPATEYLFLTIGFDFTSGLDRYFPANFTVPSNTLVVFSITNYDNASNAVPQADTAVRGTLGNVEFVRSGTATEAMAMSSVPADQVAHTFTLDSAPYNLNVPIPMAASLATPTVVTFSAYFNVTGSFQWHCLAACDPASMETPGFMVGTVSVQKP